MRLRMGYAADSGVSRCDGLGTARRGKLGEQTVAQLARTLNVTADYLLGLNPEPEEVEEVV
jgi:hypothetical protein